MSITIFNNAKLSSLKNRAGTRESVSRAARDVPRRSLRARKHFRRIGDEINSCRKPHRLVRHSAQLFSVRIEILPIPSPDALSKNQECRRHFHQTKKVLLIGILNRRNGIADNCNLPKQERIMISR